MNLFFTNIFDTSISDILEKGREAQIGEIREWKGIRYKKVARGRNGWVRVSKTGKSLEIAKDGKENDKRGMVRSTVSGDFEIKWREQGGGRGVQANVSGERGFENESDSGTDSRFVADVKSSIERVNNNITKLLEEKGVEVTSQNFVYAEPEKFKLAISANKEMNPNGFMVDVHDDYSECLCLMSEDGKSGIAVEPDGNIVSVFSSVKRDHRLEKMMFMAIAAGGNKLDCFYLDSDFSLPDLYRRFGFKIAATNDFNPKYAPDGYEEWKSKPENADTSIVGVAAMYLDRNGVEDAINQFSKFGYADYREGKRFTQKNVGYDFMLKYRDNLMKRIRGGGDSGNRLEKSLVFTSIKDYFYGGYN